MSIFFFYIKHFDIKTAIPIEIINTQKIIFRGELKRHLVGPAGDMNVPHLFVFMCLLLFLADLAAIPDFQSGAMENWGLTTYRETGLLFDPDKSSASDKLGITKVIAHELAHQVAGLHVFEKKKENSQCSSFCSRTIASL